MKTVLALILIGSTASSQILVTGDVSISGNTLLDTMYSGITLIGDSKSTASSVPNLMSNLISNWNSAKPQWNWIEAPLRCAGSGRQSFGTSTTYLPSWLATNGTAVPVHILVNLGVNDVNGDSGDVLGDGTGNAWKGWMGTICDLCHSNYPTSKMYLMRVWKRNDTNNYTAKLNLIDDTLLPQVISSRPWCFLGPDERVFLQGSDNGTNETTDGLHPSTLGQSLTANAWKAVVFP